MSRPVLWLVALLLIPCWVIGWLYEIDIKTAHWVISRILTFPSMIYGPVQNNELGRYYYGPFSLVLFMPLSKLAFVPFKIVWLLLQTTSFVLFWWFLVRLYPALFRSSWRSFFVWIIAINPIHNNFQSNNIQLMLAVILLGAQLLSRSKNTLGPLIAGVLVAGAAHVKVYPAFLAVFYFLTGRPALRWGVAGGAVGFALLPFAVFGIPLGTTLYSGFLENITIYGTDNPLTRVSDILCLPSLLARTLEPYASSSTVLAVTWSLTFLVSMAFFLWAWRRRGGDTPPWEIAWLLMAFLNPSTRVHYFVFLVPAFCWWLEKLDVKSARQLFFFVTSLLLVTFTVEGVVGRTLNNRLEYLNLPTWGILVALFSVVILKIRARDDIISSQ